MLQKLCWKCREELVKKVKACRATKDNIIADTLAISIAFTHCHCDEPEEKPKCWCECKIRTSYVKGSYSNGNDVETFDIIYCPICGKKLE